MTIEGRRASVVSAVMTAIALLVAAWWLVRGGNSRVGGAPKSVAEVGAGGAPPAGRESSGAQCGPIRPVPYSVEAMGEEPPASNLSIKFVDVDDRAVVGAKIVLTEGTSASSCRGGWIAGPFCGVSSSDLPEAIATPDRMLAAGVTDEEGSWTVPVPPGAWVRVRGTAGELSGSANLGMTPLYWPQTVRLLPTHSLIVRAVDLEGRPVPGIQVGTKYGVVVDGDRWTDSDGVARLTVWWRKDGRVKAYAQIGVRTYTSRWASRAEAAAGLNVVVDRGVTVVARILGGEADSDRFLVWPAAAGAAQIEGMEELLTRRGSESFRRFSGREVAVAGFVPGARVKFALFEDGFRRAVGEILIPDAPYCEVVLDAGRGFTEVSARLLDEAGRPRRDERVWARLVSAGAGGPRGADIVVITDSEGGVRTRLPAGTLQLAVFREGLDDARFLDLPTGSTDLGEIALPGPLLLALGTLRDAAGVPLKEWDVEAWPVGVDRESIRPWHTETSADGTFEIRGWHRGELLDIVATDGELWAVLEGVPAGATGIELVARPTGTLVGNVISPREDMFAAVFVEVVPIPAMDFERADRNCRAASCDVDHSGAFEVGELYPGVYDVLVHVFGTCTHRIEGIRIPEEGGVVTDPRLQGISIAWDFREILVRVMGPGGPLEATVALWDGLTDWGSRMPGRQALWWFMKQTDEFGEARFLVPMLARVPVCVERGPAWRRFEDPVFPLEVVWIDGAVVNLGVDLSADLPPLPGVGGLDVALRDLDAAGIESVAIGEPGTLPVNGVPSVSIPVGECRGAISLKFEEVQREVRFGVLVAPKGVIMNGDGTRQEFRGTWHWIGEFRIPKDEVTHSVRFPVSAELISRMIPR